MKKTFFVSLLFFLTLSASKAIAQNPVNWKAEDLLEPSALAAVLASGKTIPVIYSVGPGANIPNSIHIGMTNDDANLANLKKSLAALPKAKPVVIYCGCCPFEHCPNVSPAIAALKEMQFTNFKLLNLPKNLKTDWIDKGYPTVKQ
jgi:thiosulfate/3-mercaptopyruvate sulfurtransferase